MKWQVGDVAIHIATNKECEIICLSGCPTLEDCDCSIRIAGDKSHSLSGDWSVEFRELRRPDYDGNQASTWDESIFKPKELVLVVADEEIR